MNNTEYRLQMLSHSEIFTSRTDAVDYVNDYFKPESLIGEPVVCFYGDTKKPSVLMAVGVGNRKIAFIDIDEVKEKVGELSESVENNNEIVEQISKSFKSIIDACGLMFDENKIENQITYVPDRKDMLINETKSISEAVAVISKYVQENFAATKFVVEDSKSINLAYIKNEEGDGNILKAAVRISSYGDSDEDLFNNNIIGVKSDGIYATSNLTYDEEKHRLTFTSSGMKNGKFMDDANKQVIDLGEHPSYKANNDGHDIQMSVKEVADDKFEISADAKLSDDVDNILVSRDGKLFVDGRAKNIKYKSSTVFKGLSDLEGSVDTLNDKVAEIERNSVIIGDESDTMLIKANKTSNGYALTGDVRLSSDNSIVIANGGLKADIEISSDIAANKLKVRVGNQMKEVELPGVNIIKEVKYNPSTKAIYIVLNDGSSMTIPVGDMLKTWTVYNQSNSPVVLTKTEAGDIEQLSATLKLSSTDNILKVDEIGQLSAPKSVITNAVDVETTRALAAETEIRTALKEETSKREEKVSELESKVLNNEKSVNELIASDKAIEAAMAYAVEQFNTKLEKEIERAMLAEQQNKEAIETLNGDVDVPGSVEHVVSHAIEDVKVLVNTERDRAVAVEGGLEERIVSLESKLGTDTTSVLDMAKAYTDVETERAKTAEANLEDKIETLATYTYVDGKLALKADSKAVEDGLAKKADITSMNEALALKADKVETDYKLGLKADKESVYSKEEADGKFLTEHQDLSHLATKEEITSKVETKDFEYALEKKANVGDSYLKSEADAKFLTEHQDLSHLATKEDTKMLSEKDAEIEAAYKAADEALKVDINGKVSDVKLQKGDTDLVYHLMVDGKNAGTINIPEDQFLSEVTYDNANGELVFVFSTSDGFKTVRVDVKTLIDIYTAGNGLSMVDNEFSIKVSDADEGFINVSENGIKTVGIKEALAQKANVGASYTKAEAEALLDNKANVGVSYTKDESDAKFLTEHQDISMLATKAELKSESDRAIAKEGEIEAAYKAADEAIQANIDTKVADVKLEKGDSDLVYHLMVDGVKAGTINIPQDQFLKSASYDAGNKRIVFVFNTENGEMTDYVDVADLVDTYTAGNGLSMVDNKFSVKVDSASEKYLSVSENGIKVSGIDAALTNKANVGDSYLKSEADAKFLTEHQDISGLATKEEVSAVSAKADSIEAAYKAADEAIMAEVGNKVAEVKLEKGDTDLVYHLYVDGKNAGSINIPEDQFLKSASYDAGNKEMVFVFITENGETTERVNVADLVDTYTAGNGLSMVDNKFSIMLNPSSESYLSVDAQGIKLSGIDAALANKANVGDSYLKSESDAKFLTEHQDISGLATKEEVKAESERANAKETEIEAAYKAADAQLSAKDAEIEAAYKAADEALKANIDTKVSDVKLEKGDTDLVYHLMVDGVKAGSINIPEDQLLKSASYDAGNKELVFVFKTESGETTERVNVADLVDTYAAGDGLSMADNKFSVKLNPASESYLTVSADGIKLSGIDAKFAEKANVGESYTKAESDAKFLTEHQDISGLATKEEVASKVEIKDFEYALEKKANVGDSYLKSEADAKFLNKVDADAAYAKIAQLNEVATSLNGVVSDLSDLNGEVEGLKFNVASTNTLSLSMNVAGSSKELVGNVNVSNVEGNIVKTDASGIFAKVSLDYNRATNVITFNNGNGEQKYQLSDHSLVSEGYYDSVNKQIVLVVMKDGGATEKIGIPVGDLVNSFEVKNDDNNPVRLEKSTVNGVDTLSAYIRVSNVESNLISSNNGTLYASKDAKDHTAIWSDGTTVSVQEAITKLGKEIENIEIGEEFKQEFEDMKTAVATVENRVNILEGKITEVETKMTTMETTLGDIVSKLEEVQKTIDNLIDFGTY